MVSMCRALIKAEKRLGNFIVRSTFHDSLSVDVSQVGDGVTGFPCTVCTFSSTAVLICPKPMRCPFLVVLAAPKLAHRALPLPP